MGARISAGASNWPSAPRRPEPLSGSRRVSLAPPGSSTLTVTPLPCRSFAQITLMASSAAFDGP